METTMLWRRAVSLIIIFILYLIFDSSPSPQPSKKQADHAVEVENAAWRVLNSSAYGDFNPASGKWLNMTGFHQSDDWAWKILTDVQSKARELVSTAVGSENKDDIIRGAVPLVSQLRFYHNISGEVKGSWKRSSIQFHRENILLDLKAPSNLKTAHPYHRNISGPSGTVEVSFKERGIPDEWNGINARGLRARMLIHDGASSDPSLFILQGIHLVDTGSIVLVTHTEKFPALFGLPHLSLSDRQFSTYQHRLNRTLKDVINLQTARQLQLASPEFSERRNCEIVAYLQQYPLSNRLPVSIIENELRFPAGRPKLEVEELHLTMTLFSPDCGYVLESIHDPSLGPAAAGHLVGLKMEAFNSRANTHALIFGVILLLQTLSIMQQTKDSSTPSTKNRISVQTMVILTVADGFTALSFVPMVALTDTIFLTMSPVAFMAVMCAVYFNLAFLGSIWAVQYEDHLRERRQQGETSTGQVAISQQSHTVPIITAAGADTLPLPVTSGPAVSMIGSNGEDMGDGESTPQEPRTMMQSRTAFATVSLWIFSLWMTTWSSKLQQGYFFSLSILYVSMWFPQIFRNATRNCRKALRWDFIISQSILRLATLLYFYAYDKNIADIKPDFEKSIILIGLSWVQICILAIQETFGPRLLVPKSWLPPAYDYHPILREDDESTRVILGFSSPPPAISQTSKRSDVHTTGAESKESKFKRRFDCAICMQSVEVPIIPNSSVTISGKQKTEVMSQSAFLWRRKYMITPCRHVFHSKCLEAAMRYKLQCPICREGLPPL
jgi:hypothetical protein